MHISTAPDKTAHTLATIELNDDTYHRNIANAARVLYERQDAVWSYVTQFSSGTTYWRDANGSVCSVDIRGVIRH